MKQILSCLEQGITNFVFVGQSGSGKSEIAINFAKYLRTVSDKEIALFDLDMTKPLFRSRDLMEEIVKHNIKCNFQEQFMDAPTMVGGVRVAIKNPNILTILDIGGDHIGARAIGGFAKEMKRDDVCIYYVINGFRPFSQNFENMDYTFAKILGASNIDGGKVRIINNPNVGINTNITEFLTQKTRVENMIGKYKSIEFACASEYIYPQLDEEIQKEVFSLHINIKHP